MAKYVEVVIFYGPPFAGKTAYYRHHLKTSHQRISATDLFTENPDLGLRQIILRVVALLKQGINVAIDDENWLQNTRLSYVKSISAKVPNCRFRCIKFNPGPSPVTLLWLEEWYLAKSAFNGEEPSLDNVAGREARVLQWFGGDVVSRKPECPNTQEGMRLQDVHVELTAEEEYKFEVPALFVQWEGAFQSDDEGRVKCCKGTKELMQAWTAVNPWGRIIIIASGPPCADSKVRCYSDQAVLRMQEMLVELSKSLLSPVHFCCLLKPKFAPSFARPPKPGLLAFLQRLHHIDLWHPGTLYLYQSQDQADSARAAGLRYHRAGPVLENLDIVHSIQCAYRDELHPTLKHIKLFMPPDDSSQKRSAPTIPLYSAAIEVKDVGCYMKELSCGLVIGICFKDKDALNAYQRLYAETASRITDPESRMTSHVPERITAVKTKTCNSSAVICIQRSNVQTTSKSNTQGNTRGRRSWMMLQSSKKKKNDESSHDSYTEETLREEKRQVASLVSSTLYCMSAAELYEMALLILQEDKMKDSEKVKLEDTSLSSQETLNQTSLEQATTETAITDKGRDKEAVSSLDEERGKVLGGVGRKVNHPFSVESADMTSPSGKAGQSVNVQKPSNSPSVLPECLAPETVTCVPETAGYLVASMRAKGCTTTHPGEISAEQRVEGMKASKGPDLSFLDDIF